MHLMPKTLFHDMSEVKPSGKIVGWHGMILIWFAGKSPAVVCGYYPYTWMYM